MSLSSTELASGAVPAAAVSAGGWDRLPPSGGDAGVASGGVDAAAGRADVVTGSSGRKGGEARLGDGAGGTVAACASGSREGAGPELGPVRLAKACGALSPGRSALSATGCKTAPC